MFDIAKLDRLRDAAAAVAAMPVELATSAEQRDAVRLLQATQDRLAAVQATYLAAMEQTKAYEDDGASTLTAWTRQQLRLTPGEAKAQAAAGRTIRQLPAVAASARAGRIRLQHLHKFTYGLAHIGAETMAAEQEWLVDLAEHCDPAELYQHLRSLREAVYPDSLDEAWVRGMDKRDIRVDPVPDGWHVSGFLDISTGTRFHEVLTTLSAPRDAEDTTTAPERRIAGLDALLTNYLQHGMPTNKGIRPQLRIIVDHNTLASHATAAAGYTDGPAPAPAHLTGFGPIGPQLLSMLACDADLTAIGVHDTNTHRHVLNVGRRRRLANPAQRAAVLVRQDDTCAAPGCTHTHLDIHHITWWTQGGTTNLDNLIGLCTRCHHLTHRGLLTITTDHTGCPVFTRNTGTRLDNHTRHVRHQTRQRLHRRAETCATSCARQQPRVTTTPPTLALASSAPVRPQPHRRT
ncbi:MAG: DUF222 domain-containing protein [Nocardioidaceae bacterium]